jgi:hypothetical protein
METEDRALHILYKNLAMSTILTARIPSKKSKQNSLSVELSLAGQLWTHFDQNGL